MGVKPSFSPDTPDERLFCCYFSKGLALMTKTTPNVKEEYGKIKKEEKVIDDQKSSDVKPSKKTSVAVRFNNVAFLEEHGDQFWFFKTHVIPGK